jgi:hypothetical protein
MIIRILNEGQYDVPDARVDRLNELDTLLQNAVDDGDEAAFAAALGQLLAEVRASGSAVPAGTLTASDLVLPAEGTSLAEVSAILGDEGLIPG